MPRWRRRAEEGSVLVVTALALVALLGATAFSVDIGRETVVKRHLQGTADAAAADARFGLCDQAEASQLAGASFGRNDFTVGSGSPATVTLGTVTTTNGVQQFTAGADCAATSTSSPAVQVHLSQTVPHLFASGTSTPSATGTWVSTPLT
ncbi:MAG: TadG family pilus assembly protein, partial [Acidimicrobiales bacterium]